MKKLLLITTALVISASAAHAVDDSFGNRFGNSAPHALNDTKEISIDDISDLVNIAPAAGDEDSSLVDSASVTIDAEAGSEDAQTGVIAGQSTNGVGVDVKVGMPAAAPVATETTTQTKAETAPEDQKAEEIPAPESTTETAPAPAPAPETVPQGETIDAEAAADAEIEGDSGATTTESGQSEPAAATGTENVSE